LLLLASGTARASAPAVAGRLNGGKTAAPNRFTAVLTAATVARTKEHSIEFRILGPLEVSDDGREISIRGRKLQSLLAVLLLHAGEVVSRDRLIDDLWGDEPPSTARKTLQVHVSRLRREVGDAIVSRGGGYSIRVEPGELDLERFERLVADGRQALAKGDREQASELFGEALGLWRGPALPELEGEPFAQAEIGRLEDARLDAIETHIENELALGRHAEAIHELEPLVARHPYRERLHELFMLALYRAGRQADALAAYRDARRVLVEALGLEPGKRLQELNSAILAQDPALERPVARGAPAPPADAPAGRRARPLVAAGAAVALVAVLVILLAARDPEGESPLTRDSHAVAVIDPETNRVTTAAQVGTNPGPLAYEPASRSLWVGNIDDESVTRIEVDPVRTAKTIAIGERPSGLAAGNGAVWVSAAPAGRPYVTTRKIDPRFDSAGPPVKVASLPAPGAGGAPVAVDRSALWVAPWLGLLTRLDAATGRTVGRGIEHASSPSAVAAGGGAVWTVDSSTLLRIDPATGVAQPIRVAEGATDVALGAGAAWVTQTLDDSVMRIDSSTGTVRDAIPVGRRPTGVAVGAGAVWVANTGDGTVSRIDPRSGRVTDTIDIGASPHDLLFADGRLWVSVRPGRGEPEGAPGGTVRMATTSDVDYLDPALAYQELSFQVLHATCAQLLKYPARPGPAGSRPIPELAESLPDVSGGGRVYSFTIRRGFRFSPTGEPVTARSMKYSIERALDPRMRGPGATVTDIAAVSARGRRLTIRLRRPSPNLPARIALPFFCAVPLGTPIEPAGLRKVPSAGPYYVAVHAPGEEIVLRRNPHYRGFRPNRPDEIRITVGAGQAKSVAGVEAGEIDYAPIWENAATARRLQRRYGPGSPAAKAGRQRLFAAEVLQLDQLIFNTSRPPFDSARLRQAVNYALDRRALSRQGLYTELPSSPSDQYIPPGLPGFRDARIYPFEPDLETARRLAGGERHRVALYSEGGPTHMRFAEIVRANLRAIGIDVEIRAVGASLYPRITTRGEPFDMALIGWVADHPDPYDFLRQLDGRTIGPENNLNIAYFNDPDFNRRLDAAARLRSPAREIALGRLDVHVARTAAPWAALGNERGYDFFAERIGCQTYNTAFGIELGGLCIRRDE
jgi:YVTN family beta-propeller protein